MGRSIKTIVYPVDDIAQSRTIFSTWLDTEPTTDTPYYVGFTIDGQEIGFSPRLPDLSGHGPVNYVNVDDIHASLKALVEAGATVHTEARDVGGGNLIASVIDANGNVLGLGQSA